MRVDAHQHFIDYVPAEYPWICGHLVQLERDALPEDLAEVSRPCGIEATVAVQARQSINETDWLIELAQRNPLVAGVVGWVDLCDAAVEGVLERYADQPLLKGVRHVVQDEPDEEFILRDDFCRGVSKLARFGLSYDILIFSRHLRQTLTFVRRFPEQPFVIDHLAKPRIRDGEFEEWRRALRPLAGCPNVYCKVSGMVTEAKAGHWSPGDFRPYIETVLDLFGPERSMFGSDWPVCTLEASYEEVYALVEGALGFLNESESAAVLGDTAATFYRLRKSA